jgi:hypothetical protein
MSPCMKIKFASRSVLRDRIFRQSGQGYNCVLEVLIPGTDIDCEENSKL